MVPPILPLTCRRRLREDVEIRNREEFVAYRCRYVAVVWCLGCSSLARARSNQQPGDQRAGEGEDGAGEHYAPKTADKTLVDGLFDCQACRFARRWRVLPRRPD